MIRLTKFNHIVRSNLKCAGCMYYHSPVSQPSAKDPSRKSKLVSPVEAMESLKSGKSSTFFEQL